MKYQKIQEKNIIIKWINKNSRTTHKKYWNGMKQKKNKKKLNKYEIIIWNYIWVFNFCVWFFSSTCRVKDLVDFFLSFSNVMLYIFWNKRCF